MKSYLLEGVESIEGAAKALTRLLPGQTSPWVLRAPGGDAIAYFNVVETAVDVVAPAVQADISGRHWDRTDVVLSTLESLRAQLGGTITTDE